VRIEMKSFLKGIITLLKREIKIISKDTDLITIILLSPLLYALFLGTIYLNKTESDVPMVVVDMDKSYTSKAFIRNLDAHQLIKINNSATDLNSAKEDIYNLNDMGIIYIPGDFESSLKKGKGAVLAPRVKSWDNFRSRVKGQRQRRHY
jgi:ABC-2 type transport system permease protein